MAIVEGELGEHTFSLAKMNTCQLQRLFGSSKHPHYPHGYRMYFSFAPQVILVHHIVRRLIRGKRLQFKTQPWMTGTHQPVGGEFVPRTQVAAQTHRGTRSGGFRGIQTVRHILLVANALFIMCIQPFLRASVASFAPHPVADLELRSALRSGHIVSMTIQANAGGMGALQTQIPRNPPGVLVQQYFIGLGMQIFS